MVPFKRYYHLPLDTKVIFDDGFTLKAFTITHVEGLQYQLKAIPLYDERYLYTFHIRQKDELIYTSPTSADNFIYYDFPGEGTYVVSCILQLPSGHQKEVYADEPVEINRK
jgi:hypothetical protein